jgi:ParB family transcriptional regulator, chromosome partitioning protein
MRNANDTSLPATPLKGLVSLESSRREDSNPANPNTANALARQASRRFEEIPLVLIDPDPEQVRTYKDLDDEDFAEMCTNVAQYGVLQPLLVRPGNAPGRYTLVAGEFRYEAARRAGHARLPCYIEEAPLDRTTRLLHQLSENLHRKQLSHMDLARTFHLLTLPLQDGGGGLRSCELARRLGKSEAFISEHRALMQLTPEDQQSLEAGILSFEQARMKLRKRSTGHNAPEKKPLGQAARAIPTPPPSAAGAVTCPHSMVQAL